MTSQASSTSLSLIEKVKADDALAWTRLVDLYGPLVFHWAQRLGLDDHSASDVLQDVFMSVRRSIGLFDATKVGGSFRAWLWTIARNKVNDHFREVARRPIATGGTQAGERMAQVPDQLSQNPDEYTDPRQLTSLFHRALESVRCEFEERTWQMFWRSAVGNERTADIAADLGISSNAVRQARSRVLRRLRQELGEFGDGAVWR